MSNLQLEALVGHLKLRNVQLRECCYIVQVATPRLGANNQSAQISGDLKASMQV